MPGELPSQSRTGKRLSQYFPEERISQQARTYPASPLVIAFEPGLRVKADCRPLALPACDRREVSVDAPLIHSCGRPSMQLSRTLLASALIASLGGLLFGFDTIVISGAEQKFQSLWELSDGLHGWVMSSALWGTVLGALAGNLPTDRLGRKGTLVWIGILYLVSAVWSALANDPYSFMIARFLGGIGVGVSTVAAPLYISEISPADKRGLLAGLFQFNIVLGILLAFLSNSLLEGTSENDWRWMMGMEAFPAIAYTLFTFGIPESPRWLIGIRRRRAEGELVLAKINPSLPAGEIATEADRIEQAAREEEQATGGTAFSSRLRTPILLAFLVAFFNQMSGINAILYFAPRILGMAGLEDPRAGQIGIGLVNLVFTMVGLWLIDRAGRRSLLVIGSLGYIASLAVVAATFFANETPLQVAGNALALRDAEQKLQAAEAAEVSGPRLKSLQAKAADAQRALVASALREDYEGPPLEIAGDASHADIIAVADQAANAAIAQVGGGSTIVLLGILTFIASHAVGQGAVIWVLISEVFPNEHRAVGNSIGSGTHWVFAALITLFFPVAVGSFAPGYIFAFFAGMMVLQLAWVLTMVPETKGVSLEQIQQQLGIR
jgi:MFS transporter, SP family, arabinose:H+ symporter